jgi:16S rRNA (cytosine967-C5)-methyltransferase
MSDGHHASERRFRPHGKRRQLRRRSTPAVARLGSPRPPDARRAAFEALTAFARRPVYVAQVLEEFLVGHALSSPDRALAMELSAGVVRRMLTLDSLLAPHVHRPRASIEPGLWTLLQMGVYQLVFLHTPPHAAVHETVQLARRLQKPRWVPIANAVLRAVQRELTDERLGAPSADAVPVQPPGESAPNDPCYRRLSRACFPDPAVDPGGYLSLGFSMPRWLVDRWTARYGHEESLRICRWFLAPGRTCLRVNPLRSLPARVLEVLQAAGIAARPGALPEAIPLERTVNIVNVPGFAEGWFSVQDESAMHAAMLLDPQPGQRVLDLCAAPGGKTSHLDERMRNEGTVIAVDVDAERLALVDAACRRLGLSIVQTRALDAAGAELPPGPFDGILVDVPCSNTGVLGKRPEARWRITPEGISELAALQAKLLSAAAAQLAPGGRMVYSTCSIESEENEQVVRDVLKAHPGLRVLAEQSFQPGRTGDGAYQALLVRAL